MNEQTSQKKIGALIAQLREQRMMTQSELAKKLHTSQSAVARMEKGEQNFSTDMLLKIGTVLKRDIITLSGNALNFKIHGGKKLRGSISINASKNAVTALLCASLLNKGTTILHNVPNIAEAERIIETLESVGVKITWKNQTITIQPPDEIDIDALDDAAARKTRSIIMFLGALIHQFESFSLPLAGGCSLGKRTVQPHLFALENFGVNIQIAERMYHVTNKKLTPAEVVLYESGDTVTENAILAAALIPGVSTIKYASANYMVQDLCFFLQKLGVKIEGIGTSTLKVHGVAEINKRVEYYVSEDPIEAMFFIALATTTHSSLTIKRCPIDFLEVELLKLAKMGLQFTKSKEYLSYNKHTRLVDILVKPSNLVALEDKIHPNVYPGLNIDNLPFFAIIATQAQGKTLIHDWVYEDRVKYFSLLESIGADVFIADLHRAIILGKTSLVAANITCPPALRPAAAILVGMIAAKGTSIMKNVYFIDRGYEDLAYRLRKIGVDIEVLHGLE